MAAVALIASGCFPPGGLVAYLYADDGNVYYYGHMSETVGGDRPVGQGEEIGLVGEIGSATAPHLYFDMRLGSTAIAPTRTTRYGTQAADATALNSGAAASSPPFGLEEGWKLPFS